MELEAPSRNDHVDDFRQDCIHDGCRSYARKADTPNHGAGESARVTLPESLLGATVGDSIKSSIER